MRYLLSTLALGALLGTAAAAPAEAAIVTYTDRAAWEAAVSSFTEVDFNGFPGQPAQFDGGATVDVGPFSLTGDTSYSASMWITNDHVQANVCDESWCGITFGYSIDFDAPILAFGADFGDLTASGIDFDVDGETVEGPRSGQDGFFGFVSTTPFTSIRAFGVNEVHDFDNVVFASELAPTQEPVGVPAPAALSLLGAGLAALVVARRRRG
jgi:hypothetical protein